MFLVGKLFEKHCKIIADHSVLSMDFGHSDRRHRHFPPPPPFGPHRRHHRGGWGPWGDEDSSFENNGDFGGFGQSRMSRQVNFTLLGRTIMIFAGWSVFRPDVLRRLHSSFHELN